MNSIPHADPAGSFILDTPPAPRSLPATVLFPRRPGWQRFGGRFLVISIVAHLLFGGAAAYLIVQKYQAARKLTFQSGPKGPSAPTRALEHKVQMKKQNALSAPPQARRVTTTGLSKVALPDMPAMPAMTTALSVSTLSGMGAAGVGPGGFGGGLGGMGGNGGAMLNAFGARTGGVGLTGTFYDLKQDRNRKPTNMDVNQYGVVMEQFARGNFNEALFANYYKSDIPLYAPQIYIPRINANEGPKAFNLEKIVQPKMWVVLYKGRVTAPETGTFHFVGLADDVLLVRFNGRIVLDGSISLYVKTLQQKKLFPASYSNTGWYTSHGFLEGESFAVSQGNAYGIEVLIGERPGGFFEANLFIEKEGGNYKMDAHGTPILPIFRTSNVKTKPAPNGTAPAFDPDGPIWLAAVEKQERSIFDSVR